MQRFCLTIGAFFWSGLLSVATPLTMTADDRQPSPWITQEKQTFRLTTPRAATVVPPAITKAPVPEMKQAILILETRKNRITVYSERQGLSYTVGTEGGTVLAERLAASDLKARFPELYDIIMGTAWAGIIPHH
ncbi:MAG: hypothetical protein U0V70_14250 [Terriglobia bacterium]